MNDRDLIYLGSVIIYSMLLYKGDKTPLEAKELAVSSAAKLFGELPYGTVDGRKYYQQAKDNIINRKSNGSELVKDL